jgi:hypothetical protein
MSLTKQDLQQIKSLFIESEARLIKRVDSKIDAQTNSFDRKLEAMSRSFDNKLSRMEESFDNKLAVMSASFDAKIDNFARAVDDRFAYFEARMTKRLNALEVRLVNRMDENEDKLKGSIARGISEIMDRFKATDERMQAQEVSTTQLARSHEIEKARIDNHDIAISKLNKALRPA